MRVDLSTTAPVAPGGSHPIGSPRRTDRTPDRRVVLLLLAVATAIGSTGLAAGGTAGALLGAELADTSAAAGLPPGLLVVGSAVGAVLISRQAARGHRGRGLMLGYVAGVLGAATVIAAVTLRNLPLLLVGSTVLGAANSSIFLTRYAAAEASTEQNRGRALGLVFAATAIGAVCSPMLLGPGGAVAQAVGLPPLAGVYLLAVVAFGISGLLFAAASHPAVPVLGRGVRVLASGKPGQTLGRHRIRQILDSLRGGQVTVALVALAASNFIMAGIMTIAPVHLTGHGHSLLSVGSIIALHVLGMFGLSPITGHLADRFGPVPVVLAGGVLLLVAALAGIAVTDHDTVTMTGHLLLLGIGWNFGVVGGSALLTRAVPKTLRAYVEGIGEVIMGSAAAVAAPMAGILAVLGGYPALSLISAGLATGMLMLVLKPGLSMMASRRPV